MANYLIGDIQGCYDELQLILEQIEFDPAKDTLWPVGDLIGRGPKSLQTLSFLYSIRDSVKAVLGNHDLHFLACYHKIKQAKAKDRFDDLLNSPDCPRLVEWLEVQPLARLIEEKHIVCHAGLYPGWKVKKAIKRSAEFEVAKATLGLKAILNNMYGDSPTRWSKELTGYDRLRFIVNAFTRMRYCDDLNNLELKNKLSPKDAPSSLKPWFELHKASFKRKVFFGHWASLEGNTGDERFVALDTGCVWGSKLTVLRYEDGRVFEQSAVAQKVY